MNSFSDGCRILTFVLGRSLSLSVGEGLTPMLSSSRTIRGKAEQLLSQFLAASVVLYDNSVVGCDRLTSSKQVWGCLGKT